MTKKIIFVHGRSQKPTEPELIELWYSAIRHGLARDFSQSSVRQFDSIDKDFVYYGDLSNQVLNLPPENIDSRFEALATLKGYSKAQFNRQTYLQVANAGYFKDALADTFSAVLGKLHLADFLINAVAPDMAEYWGGETYYGNDIRARMTQALTFALDSADDVIVIAHSLGSVVAYDSLWKLSHYSEYRHQYGVHKKVNLFLTLGSPLGDENVKAKVKGADCKGFKRYPTNVRRWYNLSAEGDYICHDGRLHNDFRQMMSLKMLSEDIKDIYPIHNMTVRQGVANPHSSIGYLVHPEFIALLQSWLDQSA